MCAQARPGSWRATRKPISPAVISPYLALPPRLFPGARIPVHRGSHPISPFYMIFENWSFDVWPGPGGMYEPRTGAELVEIIRAQ